MDFYLDPDNARHRLMDEYRQYGSLVVAFDFDDTVYDFHKKGRTYHKVIALLKKLKAIHCYLVCWTGQDDLAFVAGYLTAHDIPFDAINEHPPFHSSSSKKIYANAYLDDRAGLCQVYQDLEYLTKNIRS